MHVIKRFRVGPLLALLSFVGGLAIHPALVAADRSPAGTLNVAVAGAIETLDPARAANSGERLCVANIYEQLFQYKHLARPLALEPGLAASMPVVSEDGLTLTIRIAEGRLFHDDACFPGGKGREVTAHDVVFSFQRLLDPHVKSSGTWVFDGRLAGLETWIEKAKTAKPDPKRASYTPASGYPLLASLMAVNDRTVRLRLTRPCPELPWMLATTYASIYPPEAVRAYGDGLDRHPVPTGPYKLLAYSGSKRVSLTRYLAWRDEHYPENGTAQDEEDGVLEDAGASLPLNAGVVVQVFDTPSAAWLAFLAGDIDITEIPRNAVISSLDAWMRRLSEPLRKRGIRLHLDPHLELHYEPFNMADPVLGTPNEDVGLALRRAICLASDDTHTIERMYGRLAERVEGVILPEMHEHDRTWAHPWRRQESETEEEAREAAIETLAEVGIVDGKLDGEPLPTFTKLILPWPQSKQEFELFQARMAKIGLRFVGESMPWADMSKRLTEGQFQMATTSWLADYPDARNFLQLLFSGHIPPNGHNISRFSDVDFDDLFQESALLPPGKARTRIYQRMQDIALEACAWRVRFRQLRYGVSQPWVRNFRHNPVESRYFAYMHVDAAARAKAKGED